jgi:hypothetical protein
MGTIYAAIAIFGMTAILGMYLLSLVLRSKTTPNGLAFTHGLLAVTALILLIVYCFRYNNGPWESLIVFLIAAAGGITLGYRDITGQPIPKWLGIVHGLAAIIGFILLLCFAFL